MILTMSNFCDNHKPRIERPEDVPDEPLLWFWRAWCPVTRYDDGECLAEVWFEKFRIIKRTPCSVWLRPEWVWTGYRGKADPPDRKRGDKLVLTNYGRHGKPRKMYAYPTRQEALTSLKARTGWRVRHTEAAHDKATAALETILEHFV